MDGLSVAVSVISGCFTIIGGIYAFMRWIMRPQSRTQSTTHKSSIDRGERKTSEWVETTAVALFLLGWLSALGGMVFMIARAALELPDDSGLVAAMVGGCAVGIIGLIMLFASDSR
jgi:hypothetical protein